MRLTRNETGEVGVSFECKERLAASRDAVAERDLALFAFAVGQVHIDGVVGAFCPILVGSIRHTGNHLKLLFSLIGHIEHDGAVLRGAVCTESREHVGSRSSIEGIDPVHRFAHFDSRAVSRRISRIQRLRTGDWRVQNQR